MIVRAACSQINSLLIQTSSARARRSAHKARETTDRERGDRGGPVKAGGTFEGSPVEAGTHELESGQGQAREFASAGGSVRGARVFG
jgi:hypothetical protein